MKSISQDQLTAYVLDELSETERAELEALLAEAPDQLSYTEDTREFCSLLQQSLAKPEAAGLSERQKQTIEKSLDLTAKKSKLILWPLALGSGAAAALVIAWMGNSPNKAASEVATREITFLPGGGGQHRRVEDLSSKVHSYTPAQPVNTSSSANDSVGKNGEIPMASEGRLLSEHQLGKGLSVVPEGSKPVAGNKTSQGLDLYAIKPLGEVAQTSPATPALTPLTSSAAPSDPAMVAGGLVLRGQVSQDDTFAKNIPETNVNGRSSARQWGGLSLGRGGEIAQIPGSFRRKEITAGMIIPAEDAAGSRHWYFSNGEADRNRVDLLSESVSPNESYVAPPENPFRAVAAEPLSTFSIDVDTASYANVRRILNQGQRPPAEAVRIEELVNYFRYAYPNPAEGKPCSVTADLVVCPWNEHHRLARVGLKAKTDEKRPKANLVFLLDVSGSMDEPNKLPLVKQSLRMLVEKLNENDRVSIVVYAGNSGLVLPPTHGQNKAAILGAIENLQPGGSTNGASGITLAYEQARKEFIKEGVNRVVLATDGDFNVGISDTAGLQTLIEKEAKSGVFLSVLGYGMGNLKDSTMETLADKGNGNYAYIDSLSEARKVLAEEMSSTLVTVAKDVKVQIEFNPGKVRSYRLLGYENRMLAKEDFNNDQKDAGEMGAGHTVTALYEIVPADAPQEVPPVDALKYQTTAAPAAVPVPHHDSPETMTVKVRYKAPDAEVSQLMELPVTDQKAAAEQAPADFKFATAVAGYGMLLKGSQHAGKLTWEQVRNLAREGKGADVEGYRGEFLQLIDKAAGVAPRP
jgi:secreted protein with Ig-like and vWFA domain